MKENHRMSRKIALRSLKNLCTFIGAIALFSYFYNWTVDLRHWYVTLVSAGVCSLLWLGFYVIEVRGGVTRLAEELSRLRSKSSELPSPAEQPPLQADPPADSSYDAEPEATAASQVVPNSLPWLNPRRSQAAIAGKKS
jgi:hypothetical protein